MAKNEPSRRVRITRRCTIDLTSSAAEQVDRIGAMFDLSVADVFRYSLFLMRTYADAAQEDRALALVDKGGNIVSRITLPVFMRKADAAEDSADSCPVVGENAGS